MWPLNTTKLRNIMKSLNSTSSMLREKLFSSKLLIFSILFLGVLTSSCRAGDEYIGFSGFAQGGTYEVKINLQGENGRIKVRPKRIKEVTDSLLLSIDNTLSGYNKGSILSRFNRGEKVLPNAMFIDIYSRSYKYYEETEGMLDVASAPLFDMWGFGFTTDSLPSANKVNQVLAHCGMKRLSPNMQACVQEDGSLMDINLLKTELKKNVTAVSEESGVLPEVSNIKLNYNAVAQGYSCDIIAKYLYSIGVKDMLVNIGEIYCDGLNPQGKPWTVGVDSPFDGNNTPGKHLHGIWHSNGGPCGIVTSGNYRKYYVKDGKKYAHTINPVTGYPVQHSLLSATVVAKNATDADSYATCCMVMGLQKAKEFILSRPDLEAYLIYEEDGEMKDWASEGFFIPSES